MDGMYDSTGVQWFLLWKRLFEKSTQWDLNPQSLAPQASALSNQAMRACFKGNRHQFEVGKITLQIYNYNEKQTVLYTQLPFVFESKNQTKTISNANASPQGLLVIQNIDIAFHIFRTTIFYKNQGVKENNKCPERLPIHKPIINVMWYEPCLQEKLWERKDTKRH